VGVSSVDETEPNPLTVLEQPANEAAYFLRLVLGGTI
jgi:hypothetical protein